MLEVRIAVEQLRRLADEIENGKGVTIGDFDVSQRINGGTISQDLRITVYHEPTNENLASVFGVDMPTTLEEKE
nr:hypothetical protein K50PH164C1_LOCUS54 [Klebsiella phage vB_Kpn_K50PH164C1]